MESQRKNDFPMPVSKNGENINDVDERLQQAISYLKANIRGPTVSNAKIISVLQENPCLKSKSIE